MANQFCRQCKLDVHRHDGNCTKEKAIDGHIARCGQPWAIDKIRILEKYCDIFATGMKNKFDEINFIDLYAGPGIYFDRTTGKEEKGSPLIALNSNFSCIFLNDLNEENYKALIHRTSNRTSETKIYNNDANLIGREINRGLSFKSITFCFVDPNNMKDLKLQTIADISRKRRVDLLINFAYGTDYRRSVKYLMCEDSDNNKFDDFFGTDEWRKIENKLIKKKEIFRANALLDLYIDQLQNIGYIKINENNRHKYIFPIYNTQKGLIYYLIFVSKHARGYEFCEKIRKYAKTQQELF